MSAHHLLSSEQHLWLCVILRQVQDAIEDDMMEGKKSRPIKTAQARSWLTRHSQGLKDICCAAGIDYKFILNGCQIMKSNGWPKIDINAIKGAIMEHSEQLKIRRQKEIEAALWREATQMAFH